LHVVLPGLARLLHLEGNVVGGERQTGRRVAVVIGKDLSGREDLVVADRRMCVGPIFGGKPVLVGERGQVRHIAAVVSAAIGAVLSDDDKDVPKLRHRASRGDGDGKSTGGRVRGTVLYLDRGGVLAGGGWCARYGSAGGGQGETGGKLTRRLRPSVRGRATGGLQGRSVGCRDRLGGWTSGGDWGRGGRVNRKCGRIAGHAARCVADRDGELRAVIR